jgi:hypothetical protein
MRNIYFDNNIYGNFQRENISSDKINELLITNDLQLLISNHNLQELLLCWKSKKPSSIEAGVKISNIIKGIKPRRFLRRPAETQMQEILLGKEHTQFSIFAKNSETEFFEKLITNLSLNMCDDKLLDAASSVSGLKKDNILEKCNQYDEMKKIFTSRMTFTEFIKSSNKVQFDYISYYLDLIGFKNLRLNIAIVEHILANEQLYPAVISNMRSNLFLSYRIFMFKGIKHDCLDDTVHLTYASHSDIFVTSDEQISEYFKDIQPYMTLWSYKTFWNQCPNLKIQ